MKSMIENLKKKKTKRKTNTFITPVITNKIRGQLTFK